ncbi:MAG TPA: hypothetical protein VIF43_04445 [Patescibacteria group bacterium]|jgi:hypothetical protein
MRTPGTEFRPDEPVLREVRLGIEGTDQNEIVFCGMSEGRYCQVAAGAVDFRIEPADGDTYRLINLRTGELHVLESGSRLAPFPSHDFSEPFFWLDNDEGTLRIGNAEEGEASVVRFPYDLRFELVHAGVIRCPQDSELRSELVHSLYEYEDRDLDGYSDRDFALQLYKERIMDALLARGMVTASRLFDQLEVAEAEILTMTPEERREVFDEAFREIRGTCAQMAAS